MNSMRFEESLAKKVDMKKVKLDVLKPWITKRTTELLKMEDDVVVEFIFNQLEEKSYLSLPGLCTVAPKERENETLLR